MWMYSSLATLRHRQVESSAENEFLNRENAKNMGQESL